MRSKTLSSSICLKSCDRYSMYGGKSVVAFAIARNTLMTGSLANESFTGPDAVSGSMRVMLRW
jgi:hypothetical protein